MSWPILGRHNRVRRGRLQARYRRPFVLSLVGLTLITRAAWAEIGFSGDWVSKRRLENNSGDHAVGDYAGTPINTPSRLRADSLSASILTLPEHQCKPHAAASLVEEIDRSQGRVRRHSLGTNDQLTRVGRPLPYSAGSCSGWSGDDVF